MEGVGLLPSPAATAPTIDRPTSATDALATVATAPPSVASAPAAPLRAGLLVTPEEEEADAAPAPVVEEVAVFSAARIDGPPSEVPSFPSSVSVAYSSADSYSSELSPAAAAEGSTWLVLLEPAAEDDNALPPAAAAAAEMRFACGPSGGRAFTADLSRWAVRGAEAMRVLVERCGVVITTEASMLVGTGVLMESAEEGAEPGAESATEDDDDDASEADDDDATLVTA